MKLPDSTVALSVYNVIAMSPVGMSVDEVEHGLQVLGFGRVEARQLERAIGKLCVRGYVRAAERLTVADPLRRPVRARDRADTLGDDPGWRAWMVHVPGRGLCALDEILGKQKGTS